MTESTKTLNSTASTLKKNPGRIGRLVKAAKLLIVPPKQYATGKSKELLEAAVAKLKAKRGLNGVVGEGAGPFSDKALQKSAADEGKTMVAGTAAGALTANAIAGPIRSAKADSHLSRMHKTKRDKDFKKVLAGKMPKRDTLKFDDTAGRRIGKVLKKSVRYTTGKGAAAGAVLTGAALLGRQMKKEASMNKEAVDKSTKDKALAASAVGSGAALGGMLAHDAKKSRVASRLGTKGAYKHMANPSVEGAAKRLADSAKTMRRMGKPLRRAGIKGAIVGGLAGAALGAAHLKKEAEVVDMAAERNKRAADKMSQSQKTFKAMKGRGEAAKKLASKAKLKGAGKLGLAAAAGAAVGAAVAGHKKEAGILNSRTVQQRGAQALKVLKRAQSIEKVKVDRLKSHAKKGLVGGAIVAGGVAVTKKNEELKKQAAALVIKDGKKYRKGTVGSAASKVATAAGVVSALRGRNLKGVAKSVLKGGALGGAYGTVRGANRLRKGEVSLSKDEMKKLTKKAAELLHHNGQDIRRGTIGSAAGKMALTGAGLGALAGLAAGPVGMIAGGAIGGFNGAVTGGLYGIARGALRSQDGEVSMDPTKFDKLKAKVSK